MKELTLGNGDVLMKYKQGTYQFPQIIFSSFIDTDKSRAVGTDVILGEASVKHLALNFTKPDSLVVLKQYIEKVEEFLQAEEDYLQMLVRLDYTLRMLEV
jgi:hypothetical protein